MPSEATSLSTVGTATTWITHRDSTRLNGHSRSPHDCNKQRWRYHTRGSSPILISCTSHTDSVIHNTVLAGTGPRVRVILAALLWARIRHTGHRYLYPLLLSWAGGRNVTSRLFTRRKCVPPRPAKLADVRCNMGLLPNFSAHGRLNIHGSVTVHHTGVLASTHPFTRILRRYSKYGHALLSPTRHRSDKITGAW
jgi:hypothetical protein